MLGMPAKSFVRSSVGTALGLLSLAAAFTALHVLMLTLSSIGGSCASGGPYVVARQCPDGAGGLVLVTIFGGLAGLLVYVLSRFAAGPRLALLTMPLLLLLMAWRFAADYLGADSGSVANFVLGIVFAAIGIGLLSQMARPGNLRAVFWNDGRVAKSTFHDWSKKVGRTSGSMATLATNELDDGTIRRIQIWSATVHVAAIAAGVWAGGALANALLT